MPSTPINNFDPTNRRNIRRNLSNQIISYTIPSGSTSGGYGLTFTPATTTFYRSERYNEIIDGLSDELIDDIPEFEPIVVSSNNLNSDLLVGEGSVVSISLYDDGNNNSIITTTDLINAGFLSSNVQLGTTLQILSVILTLNSVSATGLTLGQGSTVQISTPFSAPENVFIPTNFQDALPPNELFYYRPMRQGTQLYKKNNNGILSEPYEPYWKNDSSYSAVKSFDTTVDTNLNNLVNSLPEPNTDFLIDITEDYQFGLYSNLSTTTTLGYDIDDLKNFNQKEFSGLVIQLSNTGTVIGLQKLVGQYNSVTTTDELRYETITLPQ